MRRPFHALIITTAALVGLAIHPAIGAEELSRGAMLSASCAGCHGSDGRSPGAIPDISGKTAEFIRVSLEGFRSGKRKSTVMGRHAKGYSVEEIMLIADYLGQ
ncbi:MAG: sulfide dehydrogenase cytochrome subunit [Gammaproteobacteria bacterium]|jgi:sulfide dehydrogenase cytochrome subunit